MKVLAHLMTMLICCWVVVNRPATDRVLKVADLYAGHEETAHNSSKEIDYWLSRLGIPKGNNYCAAFVSFVLDSASVEYPHVRSGVAQHFITGSSVSANRVLEGATAKKGWIPVWKRGSTWMGHVGFNTEDWTGATGRTIEANTTPGDGQSEGRGNGVYYKERRIVPTAYFRITHFTPVY